MPPFDPELVPHVEEAARLNNLDPMLLRALFSGESNNDPNATSPKGAGGIAQIMPGTAKKYGIADPYDPVKGIYGGAKILGEALGNAEKLKQSGRDIHPVDYALRTYFAGDEGPGWGMKTAAYPAYIAKQYQALANPSQPGNPIAVQPLSNNAMPPGVARLAAAGGATAQATPGAADMSAIPKAPPGAALSVPGMPSAGNPQVAQAIPSDAELRRGLQEVGPLLRSQAATGGNAAIPLPGGQPMATSTPAATAQPNPGQPLVPTADPASALYSPQLRQHLMTFPEGQTMLSKIIDEEKSGFQRNRDGTFSPIRGGPADPSFQFQGKQAESGGAKAGELPFVAPAEAAKAGEQIHITRDGAVYKGTVYVGHAPKEVNVTDPQGNQYTAFTPPQGAVAPGMAQSLPGGTPSSGAPAPGSPPGAVMGAPSKLGPGEEAALKTRGDEEQKQRQTVINEGNTAQQSRATLMNMASEAGSFKQGPFAEHWQQAGRYLRLIDPSWTGQVASYEDFVKNAGALTRQAVRETSSKAAVQEFNMIAATLPNPEQSEVGLRRVQNELIGLTDFREAKAQAQAQWEQQHGGIGKVSGFETEFQKQASPYAFIVARMDPADRKEMFTKLQGSEDGRRELSRLGQQLTYIKQSGLAQ